MSNLYAREHISLPDTPKPKIELKAVSRSATRWQTTDREVELVASHICELPELGAGCTQISLSIDHTGQPVLLALNGKPDYIISAGSGGTIPRLRSRRPNHFQIIRAMPAGPVTFDLPATDENYHFAQPLSAGRWIVVRGRCEGAHDKNAHVFDPDGHEIASFHVGDGVNDVLVSSDDTVWVSYFDEGIYGPTELAQEGLVGFDAEGDVVLRFSDCLTLQGLGRMADCTAMNVAEDGSVWVYYYTDFPLVRLRDGKLVRAWGQLPVEFAEAFAVDGEKAVFAGGPDDREAFQLLDLRRYRHWPAKIVDRDGRRLPFEACLGSGALLYLLNGRQLSAIECQQVQLPE